MKQTAFTAVLALVLLTSAVASLGFYSSTNANPGGSNLQLSMPTEHINYTITEVNGALWAKIDGNYPISIHNQPNCTILPMLYPMPPNSTNIDVALDGSEVEWSNYTAANPEFVHKTAIGDWWMISCVLENISNSFLLTIHYEHPLEVVNGSYMFLYDLNIAEYLSPQNPTSTAYFTIRLETDGADVQAYTTPVDSTPSQWQPKEFTLSADGVISVEMQSKYAETLPGDLVVVFSSGDVAMTENRGQEEEYSVWVLPVIIDVVLISIVLYVKRKTVASAFSSRKTAT